VIISHSALLSSTLLYSSVDHPVLRCTSFRILGEVDSHYGISTRLGPKHPVTIDPHVVEPPLVSFRESTHPHTSLSVCPSVCLSVCLFAVGREDRHGVGGVVGIVAHSYTSRQVAFGPGQEV
jgi:hypothetical protein